MTTPALFADGTKDFTPNMRLHLNANQSEISNWKLPDTEYLKSLSIENPAPVLSLINNIWLETERLIEKAMAKKEKPPKAKSIFIKANNQIVNLRLNEILWIEACGDYVNFCTDKTRYIVHSTMKSIESRLPANQFTRVHRSFIIRTEKIDLIDESMIQIGKKLIPIGESYRSELMARLNLF